MKTLLLALALLAMPAAHAAGLDSVTDLDAGSGLRQALTDGAAAAVSQLGVQDGFFGNGAVKIPLPPAMKRVESALRLMGMRRQADELVLAMNRAAEAAVPEAKALLIEAVRNMSVQDAKAILTGGDTAATEYFRRTTQEPLGIRFLPIVKQATDRVGLAERYNSLAAQASQLGIVGKDEATVESYVTAMSLKGLYYMIGEKEKAFRQNPLGASSDVVRRVFGALR